MTLKTGEIVLNRVAKGFRAYHSHSAKDLAIRLLRRQSLTDRRVVLRDITLHVSPGERLGIVGRNGSGKSTLFRLISGILEPDAGEILVGGRVSPVIEVTTGLVLDLNGAENIRLNALLLGLTRVELDRRFDEIVAFAELGEFLETPVRYYSSGMQARLGFSVASHVDAPILLVDEALAVGDAAFQQRCLDRVNALSNSGTTVLFVGHDRKLTDAFCQRVVAIEDGVCVDAD